MLEISARSFSELSRACPGGGEQFAHGGGQLRREARLTHRVPRPPGMSAHVFHTQVREERVRELRKDAAHRVVLAQAAFVGFLFHLDLGDHLADDQVVLATQSVQLDQLPHQGGPPGRQQLADFTSQVVRLGGSAARDDIPFGW